MNYLRSSPARFQCLESQGFGSSVRRAPTFNHRVTIGLARSLANRTSRIRDVRREDVHLTTIPGCMGMYTLEVSHAALPCPRPGYPLLASPHPSLLCGVVLSMSLTTKRAAAPRPPKAHRRSRPVRLKRRNSYNRRGGVEARNPIYCMVCVVCLTPRRQLQRDGKTCRCRLFRPATLRRCFFDPSLLPLCQRHGHGIPHLFAGTLYELLQVLLGSSRRA